MRAIYSYIIMFFTYSTSVDNVPVLSVWSSKCTTQQDDRLLVAGLF